MSSGNVTEDEAKTKECPIKAAVPTMMTHMPYGYGLSQQQQPLGWPTAGAGYAQPCYPLGPAMCTASACMMWRDGGRKPFVVERLPIDPSDCPINPPPSGWVRQGDEYVRNEWADVGYCGLAGEP